MSFRFLELAGLKNENSLNGVLQLKIYCFIYVRKHLEEKSSVSLFLIIWFIKFWFKNSIERSDLSHYSEGMQSRAGKQKSEQTL